MENGKRDGAGNSNMLIINCLPQALTDDEFHNMFLNIGPLQSCKISRDRMTNYSYGFGFVEYETEADAHHAIAAYDGKTLPGYTEVLSVKYADDNGDNARTPPGQAHTHGRPEVMPRYASPRGAGHSDAPAAPYGAPQSLDDRPRSLDDRPRPPYGEAPYGAPRSHDDAPRPPYGAPRSHDDAPRPPYGAPRSRDDAGRSPYDAPWARDDAPRSRDDPPWSRDDAPWSRNDAPWSRDDAPRSRDDAAWSPYGASRSRDDAARSPYGTSRSRDDVPWSRDDAPRSRDDAARSPYGAPRSRDDAPRSHYGEAPTDAPPGPMRRLGGGHRYNPVSSHSSPGMGPGMGSGMGQEPAEGHILFIYNIDPNETERFLEKLFTPYGKLKKVNVIKEHHSGKGKGYGFVTMANRHEAVNAIRALNGFNVNGKALQVSFKTSNPASSPAMGQGMGPGMGPSMGPGMGPSMGPIKSEGYILFIYNIDPDADESFLWKLFVPYGAVTKVNVIKDSQTGKGKGYGFVTMANHHEALNAIEELNGVSGGSGKALQVSFKTPAK